MKHKEICTASTKALIAAIPVVGGSITSLWSDIEALNASRKMERLESFLNEIDCKVEKIQDKINPDYIGRPDFLDVFETTAKKVVNERLELKRKGFQNILLNSIVSANCTYDKTEAFLRILENMSENEILILTILRNPKLFNQRQNNTVENPNGTWTTSTFISLLLTLSKLAKDDLIDAIRMLTFNRLITDEAENSSLQTNGNPIDLLEDKLSKKGKEFIKFVTDGSY